LAALGREIRRYRKAKGLSQESLAERADLHLNYIGLLERGQRNPSFLTLLQVARALDIGVGNLVVDLPLPPKETQSRSD
jgi:transcriptional regulator with XRE-family HTH domain